LNILHVTRQFYPSIGGIETTVYQICRESLHAGNIVSVVALDRGWTDKSSLSSFDEIDGIKVFRVPFIGSKRYAIAPRVLNYIQNQDIIHIHSNDFFLDFLSATKFLHKKRMVLHTHGLFFHTDYAKSFKQWYLRKITKQSIKRVAAVICDSRHDVRMLDGLVPPEKIHLIPDGIDPRIVNLKVQTRDPNLILSVGRLSQTKRYHLLLKAFCHVLEKKPLSKLVIIGKDEGERSDLENLSIDLKIDKQVQFLGEVAFEEMLDYLGRASIWATASGYESFGISTLESMAAGCVPVIQKLEAFEDFFQDKISGYYTDFSNSIQAGNQILEVLSAPHEQLKEITNVGRKIAHGYTWQKTTEKIIDLYKDVASSAI
jgi:alpha-1,3-mannosyltransferase